MIEVRHLSKRYAGSKRLALNDVSFSVQRGEIVGLLGHNGAGKSTILGVMLGMVRPDAGDVHVANYSVRLQRAQAMRQIGAIFESAVFYDYMTGWQNLKVLCSLSGWWDEAEAARVLDMVQLARAAKEKIATYSHGMRQRLALAQALLPRPSCLLLDEPTDGLDPEGIREFRETILRLRQEWGMTILFNSHLLAEVEQMCDRCVIIKEGRKVHEGPLRKGNAERPRYELSTPDRHVADAVAHRLGATLSKKGLVTLPSELEAHQFVKALVEGGARINSWQEEQQSLEEIYLQLAGKHRG
jgi:ABC-2 type transport system ATP-binding protein